jgi:fibronectin type 3 domain-containing protein
MAYSNNSKENSSQSSAVKVSRALLKTPAISSVNAVTVVDSYEIAQLKWKSISGATGYRVLRSTSKNGKYSTVEDITTNTYNDVLHDDSITYYYKVVALVNGKVASKESSVYTFKPVAFDPDYYKR